MLRLGFVANFISEPVLIGFKAGIGLVIVVDQVPKLLGIHFPKGGILPERRRDRAHLPRDLAAPTLAVGVAMMCCSSARALRCRGSRRRWSRSPPASPRSALFGLQRLRRRDGRAHPAGTAGVHPAAARRSSAQLWPGAPGIALMSFTETIAAGRAFAAPSEPPPMPTGVAGDGLANIGGGLFGAMPAGGGTSQTAVNRFAGARTPDGPAGHRATAVATLLLLAPLIGLMPQATLAAVVIVYSIGLIKPRSSAPS